MKTLNQLMMLAILGIGLTTAQAVEKVIPGPKGGQLLENEGERAEFFVEKDRTITITFYDKNLKPVAVSNQSVMATAEIKSGKIKIEFEKKGDVLVSKMPLPEGSGYTVVIQLKATLEAKPKFFRVSLNLENCGVCKRAEYACICEGH